MSEVCSVRHPQRFVTRQDSTLSGLAIDQLHYLPVGVEKYPHNGWVISLARVMATIMCSSG